MAEFEPTGVKLIAEGRDEYLRAIESARRSTFDFSSAASAAGAGLQTMSMGSMALSVAVGTVLAGAFQAAVSGIINLTTAGIQMTSSLQDARIGIESLAAQEILASGMTDNMTDALAMAGPVTDDLMNRLKEISLVSPFEYRQILEVFQMNKAFGQSIDMSLKLTAAITDLGAVNRNIPGILQRISYNFSQMALTGQITGRDLRDLSQAGVDLSKVLRDELGKSIEEVNADLQSGKMTFEQVSEAFVGYVDKNFGTAAERASKTFSGLKSSFNDLAFFSSIDVFGGALDAVTEKMGGLFDEAQKFVAAGGLKPIGAVLEVVTGQLMSAGEAAVTAGKNFFDQFGAQINATATAAADWGANVVIQLATGLMDGASVALGAAMDYIGGMLSYFLSPGSPPRVAPEIDKWGAAAMSQFLGGFQNADFSTLKGVESGLQGALSALVGAGDLDQAGSRSIFQGISKQITEVIATGSDLTPVLDKIRANLGQYGAEVATLTERQFALGKALEIVNAAEDALKKTREEETQANEDLVRITDEYNDLARAGASPEILAAKRAEFENAKRTQKTAAQARKEAEKGVETSKVEAAALKEKADLQADLVQQLIELTKTQKESEKKEKSGGAASAAKKPGGAKPPAFDTTAMSDELQKKMDELKEKIRLKLEEFWKPLTTKWDEAQAYLAPKWEAFSSTLGGIYTQYIEPIVNKMGELVPPEFAENVGWAAGVLLVLAAALGIAALAVFTLVAVLQSPLLPILLIIGAIALLKTAWDTDWAGIRTTLTDIWNNNILPVVTSIQTWLATNIPKAIETLKGFWENTLLPALKRVWAWIDTNLIPLFEAMGNLLSVVVTLAITALTGAWENVLLPAMKSVWKFISEKLKPVFDEISKFINETVAPAVDNLAGFVGDTLVSAFEGVTKKIQESTQGLKDLALWLSNLKLPPWLTPGSPTPWEMGLRGVIDAMGELNSISLPKLQTELTGTNRAYSADAQAARMGLASPPASGSTVERNYNLTLKTGMDATTVSQGFEYYRLLGA